MKIKLKMPDKILLLTILTLLGIGIVSLISASIQESQKDFANIYGYFVHQLLYGFLLGGILGYLLYRFPYQKLKKMSLPIFAISLLLMLLVFIPQLSVITRGAQRWLNFGFFTFQPSELVKLTFIIYLAAWFSARIKEINKKNSLISFSILLGILFVLLILQPDLSTLGIIAASAITMYFVAGANLKHLVILGGMGLLSLFAFIKMSPYRLNRIITLLDPASDPLGIGYQINQILIAIGSGRFFGTGILRGAHKAFLPIAISDSIFAVWAEETGFLGSVVLVLLFLILVLRSFKLANLMKDNFAKLLMVGISSWFFIQATTNIAALLGIFPLTGITLPFISYGSSSMVITLMASGLLLQLSKLTK